MDAFALQLNAIAINAANDAFPGGGSEAPGLIPGQLGQTYDLRPDTPVDTAISTVYRDGAVRYVKVRAAATLAPVAGGIAYWYDRDLNEVTMDTPAGGADVAGVFLNPITKGNCGFIKISGDAQVKFLSSTTKTTPAAGDTVVTGGAGGLADVLADASAVTFGTDATDIGRILGVLKSAVSSQLARVGLRFQST